MMVMCGENWWKLVKYFNHKMFTGTALPSTTMAGIQNQCGWFENHPFIDDFPCHEPSIRIYGKLMKLITFWMSTSQLLYKWWKKWTNPIIFTTVDSMWLGISIHNIHSTGSRDPELWQGQSGTHIHFFHPSPLRHVSNVPLFLIPLDPLVIQQLWKIHKNPPFS